MNWTPDALGDLAGKTFLVTGANSGIGLEATKILCSRGGSVIIGCRSEDKANAAIATVKAATPAAEVTFVPLDLADASSVAAAADQVLAEHDRLDALVNNAGVMQTPEMRTAEGFELQIATNHFGHFRLGARLFPLIERSGGRIVAVSSVAHRGGSIQLGDLNTEKAQYSPLTAYCQSKLANLMFAFELDRRLRAANSAAMALGCHPGYAATNLQSAGVGMDGGSVFFRVFYKFSNALVAQSAERGSWPLVMAAAWDGAQGGAYYGPTRFGDARGPVGESTVASQARDAEVARKLWEETEALVGAWPVPVASEPAP